MHLVIFKRFTFMYIYVYTYSVYTPRSAGAAIAEQGYWNPCPGVIDRYEPYHMGSGNKIQSPARIAGTLNHWALSLAHIHSSSLQVCYSRMTSCPFHDSLVATSTTLILAEFCVFLFFLLGYLSACWLYSVGQECLPSLGSVFHMCPKIVISETQHKIINILNIINHFCSLFFSLYLVWYSRVNFIGNKVMLDNL